MRIFRLALATLAMGAIAQTAFAEGRVTGCTPDAGFQHKKRELVLFDTGSSAIKAEYRDDIARAAKWARDRYIQKICLIARADPRGNEQFNRELSLKRANAVAAAMRQEGVGNAAMESHAVGEAPGGFLSFLDDDSTADRRVEIIMVK